MTYLIFSLICLTHVPCLFSLSFLLIFLLMELLPMLMLILATMLVIIICSNFISGRGFISGHESSSKIWILTRLLWEALFFFLLILILNLLVFVITSFILFILVKITLNQPFYTPWEYGVFSKSMNNSTTIKSPNQPTNSVFYWYHYLSSISCL